MSEKKINWGILGPGKIARKFAEDLSLSETGMLFAVASRDINKAREFGEKHNSVKHYGSYAELADDPEVDAIYVATPHVFHFENTMMCLKKGKAVLCEKPMGIDREQVETMVREAQSRDLFLMEGIWTRFIPATERMLEILNQNLIGDLSFISADFGFKAPYDPESRLYNKELAGGSLLDIGIYPIYLSLLTLGMPENIQAVARMTQTGVDSYCSMLFDYENGSKANLNSTLEANTPTEAIIYGEKGHVKLHKSFHHAQKITFSTENEEIEEIPYRGNGYFHEIEEVNQCLFNQQKESTKLPLKTSLELISLLDKVRDQIGLKY